MFPPKNKLRGVIFFFQKYCKNQSKINSFFFYKFSSIFQKVLTKTHLVEKFEKKNWKNWAKNKMFILATNTVYFLKQFWYIRMRSKKLIQSKKINEKRYQKKSKIKKNQPVIIHSQPKCSGDESFIFVEVSKVFGNQHFLVHSVKKTIEPIILRLLFKIKRLVFFCFFY